MLDITSRGYEIVPYGPEHEAAVARLYALHSTLDPAVNAAYLQWKYDRNPYIRKRHLYLILHKGEVVAMRGYYGSCWEPDGQGGRSYTVPCAADLLIRPEHRDRGLFTGIMREADEALAAEGYPFIFSFTPSPVTAMGLLAQGWKAVGPLGEMRRESGVGRVRAKAKRWLKRHFSAFVRRRAARNAVAYLNRSVESGKLLCEARHFKPFDDRASHRDRLGRITVASTPRIAAMVRLVKSIKSGGRLCHRRDEAYLTWRYANPFGEYRFLYYGDEMPEGYLVLHAPRYKDGTVKLVDWEGTSAGVKRELLLEALTLGDFASAQAWALGQDEESLTILAGLGFEAEAGDGIVRLGNTVLAKALVASQGRAWMLGDCCVTNPANWQFRMIYSDYC